MPSWVKPCITKKASGWSLFLESPWQRLIRAAVGAVCTPFVHYALQRMTDNNKSQETQSTDSEGLLSSFQMESGCYECLDFLTQVHWTGHIWSWGHSVFSRESGDKSDAWVNTYERSQPGALEVSFNQTIWSYCWPCWTHTRRCRNVVLCMDTRVGP